jgi:hypothetical protein
LLLLVLQLLLELLLLLPCMLLQMRAGNTMLLRCNHKPRLLPAGIDSCIAANSPSDTELLLLQVLLLGWQICWVATHP